MSMERLSHQIDAYVAWKRELMREITRYRGWLERSRLNSPAVEAKLERAPAPTARGPHHPWPSSASSRVARPS